MSLDAILWILALVVVPCIAAAIGWRQIQAKHRAERNIQSLLQDVPEREAVAELILRNPNSENIQKGRDLVIGVLGSLSPKDRKEISSGFYQDSIRARAWYTAKLVTGGRSNHFRRIPTDERVTT